MKHSKNLSYLIIFLITKLPYHLQVLPSRGISQRLGPINSSHCVSPSCGGIPPERVEPSSPIELTTFRTEVPQARRSCAKFSPSPSSIVCIRKLAVWGEVSGLPWVFLPTPSVGLQLAFGWSEAVLAKGVPWSARVAKPTEPILHELCRYTSKAEAAPQFYLARNLCASPVECGGCCHCQRPPTSCCTE